MKKILLTLVLLAYFINYMAAQEYIVVSNKVRVYLEPNQKTEIGYITKGYTIKDLKAYNREWSYIDEGKIKGYINNENIKEIRRTEPSEKKSYTGIISLIAVLVVIGLILINIKERKAQAEQYDQSLSSENTTFIYKSKSVAVAIILTMLFGPLGMLYSTIRGALTMIILPIIAVFGFVYAFGTESTLLQLFFASSTLIFFSLYWFICILWGAVAASQSVRIKKI